ncbi:UNVERIFIED_CONTAM: hypothetical protein PYX00_002604 [Menopon gallinae]|uniref:Endonuclease/exonuclease/phosphatase domain-containing protein n=1 Tax=Menopon gallinae TaxID=328185 RepID=A0AAW2HXI4_9NEOP
MSRETEELMVGTANRMGTSVIIVSEPCRNARRNDANQFTDEDGDVRVIQNANIVDRPFRKAAAGKGYVIASDGRWHIAGRDFNARSRIPRHKDHDEGRDLGQLYRAGEPDGSLVKTGNLATCIRRKGTSLEDLTLVNVAARDANASWEVLEEVESLSDHAYVKYETNPQSSDGTDCRVNDRHSWRTWKLKTLNYDVLRATLVAATRWSHDSMTQDVKLELALTSACNKNILLHGQGRGGPEVEEKIRESAKEHKSGKERAWKELVKMTDPWGRPYKVLTKKMRPAHR